MLPTACAAISPAERGPDREDPVLTKVRWGILIVLDVIIPVVVPRVRLDRGSQQLSTFAPVDVGAPNEGGIEEGGLVEQRGRILSSPGDSTGRVSKSSSPWL